mmetsp:Transcript_74312/g.154946  ORF Transcript_74312/g.154946 Transcript_74312/m.154946 type:complete len:214 (-) Transcript_74312:385-1026(-)
MGGALVGRPPSGPGPGAFQAGSLIGAGGGAGGIGGGAFINIDGCEEGPVEPASACGSNTDARGAATSGAGGGGPLGRRVAVEAAPAAEESRLESPFGGGGCLGKPRSGSEPGSGGIGGIVGIGGGEEKAVGAVIRAPGMTAAGGGGEEGTVFALASGLCGGGCLAGGAGSKHSLARNLRPSGTLLESSSINLWTTTVSLFLIANSRLRNFLAL